MHRNTFRRQATLADFATRDTVFMDKISAALTTIHETYGYQAVQDCLKINEKTGEAEVDIEILCAMLDRSKSKLKSECCAMFIASKSILGSFMYLFGSLLFGANQYFNDALSPEAKALYMIIGTSFYLMGGILFILAAIEPYWNKTWEISKVSSDVQSLRKKGSIIRKMGRRAKTDNKIMTRMSRLNINTKAMLLPTVTEQKQIARKLPSDDIFETIAEEQHNNNSSVSSNSSKATSPEKIAVDQYLDDLFPPNVIHIPHSKESDEDDDERSLQLKIN